MKEALFDKNGSIKRVAIPGYENYVYDVMSDRYWCGEKETLLTEEINETEADDDEAHDANTSRITVKCDKADTISFDYKDTL